MASSTRFLVSRCQRLLLSASSRGLSSSSGLPNPLQSLNHLLYYRSLRPISSSRGWAGQSQSLGSGITTTQTPTPESAPPATEPETKPVPPGSRMSRYKTQSIRYVKNLLNEYKTVMIEAYQDGVANPARSACYFLLLGGVVYLIWSNPTEENFQTEFTISREQLDVVGEPVRSPKSEQYVRAMSRLHNRGELRYTDLVLFSVVWRHEHDRELGIFQAQCKYLQPAWSEMWDRLIDVGVAGRWWISRRVMQEYDVNEWEWEPAVLTLKTSA